MACTIRNFVLQFAPAFFLMPLSFLSVALLEKIGFVERFIQPITLSLVEESHQPYLMLLVFFLWAHIGSTILNDALLMLTTGKQVESHNRRKQKAEMSGLVGRAHCAQLNLYEGFPGFVAALFTATVCKIPLAIRFHMTALYVFFRGIYYGAFLADAVVVRAYAFLAGIWCCFIMFAWAIIPGYGQWFTKFTDIISLSGLGL